MDGYLRLGLLLIAILILSFIVLESWLRKRRFKTINLSPPDKSPTERREPFDGSCRINLPVTEEPMNVSAKLNDSVSNNITEKMSERDFLVLSIFAKPNCHFASYDLLQAISTTGMQYGEMNIFHYYLPRDQTRGKLFSLASATNPGDFNLDRMGDFTCVGLTLFMDLRHVPDPEFAFNLMLKTAEQLTDDLEADLYAGPRQPWNSEMIQDYRQRIAQYKEKVSMKV